MKSETLANAVESEKTHAATSSLLVSTTGELITEVLEEETEEEAGTMLERIINAPKAAKAKNEDDEDDDDDEDFDDEDDDLDDDDFEDEDASDEDFEEFDMPKSKPGTGAGKKEDDDFELEEDFDDFDDFDDEEDDDF